MPAAGSRWHQTAGRAAIVNAALIVLVPFAFLTYADYISDAVRPVPRTLPMAAGYAVRTLITVLPILLPLSFFVGWRTYVHARAYRERRASVWRGPLESAAVAGGIALLVMLRMTMPVWTSRPPLLLAGYISFYVIGTAIAGLLLGMMLASTALLVLRVSKAPPRTTDERTLRSPFF